MNTLAINLENLIHQHTVESIRIEFKKSWSDNVLEQTIRTICAFANDLQNLNGGYIIIGIEERHGQALLPPAGLDNENIDELQKRIRAHCKRIIPEYQPIISPETYQGKAILVIWAPGGDFRPYQAPKKLKDKDRIYYVRLGSETVEAKGHVLTQLLQLTAKIPFDDRRNFVATMDDISPTLVRNYLSSIRSDLVAPEVNNTDEYLFRNLKLLVKINDHYIPRNITLMFFSNDPEQFFPGSRIEVLHLGDDAGGDLIEKKTFQGPLHIQIRQTVDYLNSLSTMMIKKLPDQLEAPRFVSFPYNAMEEAVVNAVYHKDYERPDPVRVYLYPDRMEILSYPGPLPGIEKKNFQPPVSIVAQHRNRRIGEFLQKLELAEGVGTGIPKIFRNMRENGSPTPIFDFDDHRSYFKVILPAHPQYIVLHALRECGPLWAKGEQQQAINLLENAFKKAPSSIELIAQIIDYGKTTGQMSLVERFIKNVSSEYDDNARNTLYVTVVKALLNKKYVKEATQILANAPIQIDISEILASKPQKVQQDVKIELALHYKRVKRFDEAHKIYLENFDQIKNNPQLIYDFVQIKILLAISLKPNNNYTKTRLNKESIELLYRVIQLSSDSNLAAWSWFQIARSLNWLRKPKDEVIQAYKKAIEILPNEKKFTQWFKRLQID